MRLHLLARSIIEMQSVLTRKIVGASPTVPANLYALLTPSGKAAVCKTEVGNHDAGSIPAQGSNL